MRSGIIRLGMYTTGDVCVKGCMQLGIYAFRAVCFQGCMRLRLYTVNMSFLHLGNTSCTSMALNIRSAPSHVHFAYCTPYFSLLLIVRLLVETGDYSVITLP